MAAAAAAALLPWRRSKWVLVGREERKRPGKGWAPRLSCASLLAGLLGSCPELWPAGAPGGLFRRRRRTARLNAEEPTFRACYLGHAATLLAKGEGCAEAAVEKLWARSQAGRRGARTQLSLGPQGLHLRPVAAAAAAKEGRPRAGHAYLLHRITYCAADRRHPRVLAWVYRHQVKNKAVALRCHAVLLSRAEKAQAAARLLFQTSAAAFDEFKRLQRRSDARRLQRQLLGEAVVPLAPLRRLLNAKCPYRPPPDRGRNGSRLSSIQEEEEEEEEQEQEQEEGRRRKEHLAPLGMATGAPLDWLATCSIICAIGSAGPALWADHTAHRGRPGAALPEPKMTRCLERPEMQTLVREFQFCSLQGALPVGDTASWRPPSREPPCLSR
ncbi:protein FAM43B [Crotalus tigris]|uniref:protein FAM43B n=1 Tax=Crotalus tigris TaxID=88082 RepID=UPI00192F8680|nr:protein FAM43B [Crotalus tigris]